MDKFPVTRAGPQWTKKIRGTSIGNATGGEGMSSTGYEVFFMWGLDYPVGSRIRWIQQ